MSGSGRIEEDLTLKQMLFSSRGRIPRVDAIFAILSVQVTLGIVAALFVGFAMTYHRLGLLEVVSKPPIFVPLAAIYLLSVWTLTCILAKRCHDRDRSAWFLLLGLIPVVNMWVAIELFFLCGSRGLNHFGPVPRGMISQWQAENKDL